MRPWLALLCAFSLAACGGANTRPPQSPAGGQAATAPAAAATSSQTGAALTTPESVPPPPPECASFVSLDATASGSAQPEPCGSGREQALGALADALELGKPPQRHEALAALEVCPAFPPGAIRALRAELLPVECADVIVAPVLESPPAGLSPEVRDALLGLAYAGQLARLVRNPPVIEPPFSKARFAEFLRGPLGAWVLGQARAIDALAAKGAELSGYGKGITAVEAGLADMRFVEVVREVPLPEELARDNELRDVYYMALDEALEPRKDRGRDAALVGLRIFASLGVLHDQRVERARALLSKLYNGRRIDRLDELLLPPLPPPAAGSPEQRLAALLPAFHSGILLQRFSATEPKLLRALLERGIAPVFRSQLESTPLSSPARQLYARALVHLGQRYWRSEDFARAAKLVELDADGREPQTGEARLLAALAIALRTGPKDAAEMMLRGPFLPDSVGNLAKLDELAKSRQPVGAWAAYDAALILEMVPPHEADPRFWNGLAGRFQGAAARLLDPAQRRSAQAHAQAAAETAQALQEQAAE